MTTYPQEPLIDLEEYGLQSLADDFWSEHSHSPHKDSPHFSRTLIRSFILHFIAIFVAQSELIEREGDSALVQRMISYLAENFTETLTINRISNELNVPVATISKAFNSSTGMTVPSFINLLRASKVADLLRNDTYKIQKAVRRKGRQSFFE